MKLKKTFSGICFIFLFMLIIFDLVSSCLLINHPDFERNILMAYLMKHIGVVSALFVTKIVSISFLLFLGYVTQSNTLPKRAQILTYCGFILNISFYSYYMYNYNLAFLLEFR